MRSLLRFVLLCLMAVALPLQGLAATGALHCATMHERMQGAGGHHHDDAADHHDHGSDAAGAAEAGADAGPDEGAGRLGGQFKCSACAACCVGVGLPAGTITLPSGPAGSPAAGFAAHSVEPFLTSGPERPPRVVLA